MDLEWLPLPPLALMTLVFPGIVLLVVSFLDGTFGKRTAARETFRRIPTSEM